MSIWFAVAPGQKYRLEVSTFTSDDKQYKYDMKVAYTKVDDTFEPNQSKADAKPLSKGVGLEAFLSAGLKSARPVDADMDDWYSIDLAAGKASIRLENVPNSLNGMWYLVDNNGTEITSKYGANNGASVINDDVTIDAAGKFFVKVTVFGAPPSSGAESTTPSNYTQKYKLTVNQP